MNSGNETINRALIQQLPTLRGSIVAGVAADAGSSPSTQACEIFPSSASSATPLTLFADKPSGETIYALRGPSGKGDLQLVQMPAPTGEGRRLVGSSVMSDGWKIVESWGRLLLRYSEEPVGLSHWGCRAPRGGGRGWKGHQEVDVLVGGAERGQHERLAGACDR